MASNSILRGKYAPIAIADSSSERNVFLGKAFDVEPTVDRDVCWLAGVCGQQENLQNDVPGPHFLSHVRVIATGQTEKAA